MMKVKLFIISMLLTFGMSMTSQKKTVRKQKAATAMQVRKKKKSKSDGLTPLERKVIGRHMLSLQWISWDYFGVATITKQADGRLKCVGKQLSRENSDYLKIDGYITIIDGNNLQFTGTIATRVYHINNGNELLREGTFDFKSYDGHKYWRLQQMYNGECTDYVDIFFKR